MSGAPVTLGDWLKVATARLRAAGHESAAVEARRLAEAVLSLSPAGLVLAGPAPLGEEPRQRLDALVTRRCAHEPLQYLTGHAAFRALELLVGPGVFIPRPETEGLVELALPFVRAAAAARAPAPARVLELCAGSGAILAALLTECPEARGVAVELSPAAAAWAVRNLAGTGVTGRATLLEGDLYGALPPAEIRGDFDMIVSNPPYIPTAALAHLPADVRRHEPSAALDGGPDGTWVISRIIAGAGAWLAAGGRLALEIDESHGNAVRHLLLQYGFTDVVLHTDAAGRPRYAIGRHTRLD